MSILAECPMCRRKQSNKNKFCPKCSNDMDKSKRSKKVRYWINYRMPGGKQPMPNVFLQVATGLGVLGHIWSFSKRITRER